MDGMFPPGDPDRSPSYQILERKALWSCPSPWGPSDQVKPAPYGAGF
jgi:hypothetical protein